MSSGEKITTIDKKCAPLSPSISSQKFNPLPAENVNLSTYLNINIIINIPDASLSFVLNRTDINNIWTVWIMLACGLQRSLAGSTFNIPTIFCSFSGFLLDVVTRSVESQATRLLPKLDAMQTAWRRWATFQYSFSAGGPLKRSVPVISPSSLKLNNVSYQFLVVSNESIVLKTMPWILFFTSIVDFERNNRHLFNKLKRTNCSIDCPISRISANFNRFQFGHV